ncbi:MAG TPA: hypothetical protein PK024_11765, partial [Methanospirillum sp.]|uniref:hypothetical protein n=1 Tax=Methanospirillum sp. TaxID=45200 RepID=UPI002CF4B693
KTNYTDVPNNFYNIKSIPQKMLNEFKDNRKAGERLIKDSEGTLIGLSGMTFFLFDPLSAKDRH